MGQTGFQESQSDLALKFEPDQDQVGDQGGPDLDEHSILGSAVKDLDHLVLFNPFEKEFNLPTTAVKFGQLQGGQAGGWSKRHIPHRFPALGSGRDAGIQDNKSALGGPQPDHLIGQDRARGRSALDHKPDATLVQLVEPSLIQVGPVKGQQIARLEVQVLSQPVMGLAIGDEDAQRQHLGEDSVCGLMASLRVRNLAQGKTLGQRSMSARRRTSFDNAINIEAYVVASL